MRIELTLCELDEAFRPVLAEVCQTLTAWLAQRGIELAVTMIFGDYVLLNAASLDRDLFGAARQFDLAIANPPY